MRPGCGSKSVDPDLVDSLRARFAGDVLKARHIEIADLDDEMEVLFDHGFTDGLPVVPPTPERVLRMLEGTTRAPDEVVAVVPPDLVEVTVEKIAINAVMAGCKPEYLPWVITIIEAICTDEFNIHGVLATTMPVGPVIICNGPGTERDRDERRRQRARPGQPGQPDDRPGGAARRAQRRRRRAGRRGSGCAWQSRQDLVLLPRAGGDVAVDVARREPWRARGRNAVTIFPGEGPRCVVDQKARDPEPLIRTFAACLKTVHHPKLPLGFDAILIVGPEHARVFADAGWSREQVLDALHAELQLPGSELVQGAGGMAEGVPEALRDATLPKFRPGGILLVHAGGGAGLFSMIVAGWANGATGSIPVTRVVQA